MAMLICLDFVPTTVIYFIIFMIGYGYAKFAIDVIFGCIVLSTITSFHPKLVFQ